MFRRKSSGSRDRKFFRSTHDLTKKVNIDPFVPRGGVRF